MMDDSKFDTYLHEHAPKAPSAPSDEKSKLLQLIHKKRPLIATNFWGSLAIAASLLIVFYLNFSNTDRENLSILVATQTPTQTNVSVFESNGFNDHEDESDYALDQFTLVEEDYTLLANL